MDRRKFLLAGASASLAAPGLAWASARYPERPVRLIVPFQPGSVPDLWARALGSVLSPRLGQPVVVENVAGAGGTIGAAALKRAAPDGLSLGLFASTHAINAHLFVPPPYDLVRDFAPIGLLSGGASVLAVPASSPYRSARELMDAVLARPGALSYASGGKGSIAHLATEALLGPQGGKALHVPYKGAPAINNSLLAGETQFGMPILGSVLAFVREGKLRALAVSSAKRSVDLPDVPTLVEAIPPGFVMESWSGLFAPAKTPTAITERVFQEISTLQREGAFDKLARSMGSELQFSHSREAFGHFVKLENERYRQLVLGANLQGAF